MDGWRFNLTVTFNMKKMLIFAILTLSVLLSVKIGCADALFLIIPAGLYGMFSKEV